MLSGRSVDCFGFGWAFKNASNASEGSHRRPLQITGNQWPLTADHQAPTTDFCRTMPLMIAKDLLEILVCPACKQPLEYRERPESLKCTQCRRVYPVKDDIPIMLVDEATIEG